MHLILKRKTLLLLTTVLGLFTMHAQQTHTRSNATDSIVTSATNKESTMMLNATNATAPREVNIGLPSAVAGTSVNNNALPTMYFYWPVFPTNVWRLDASTSKFETVDLFRNAIFNGEVGVAVNTEDNLGTETLKGSVSTGTNTFGLFTSTGNVSAPINKNGFLFNVGYYLNYDPGSAKTPFWKNSKDQTNIYKFALTQKYNNGKGRISVLYKYMRNKGMLADSESPFYYNKDGKVDEIPGIKIGRASFYERTGMVWVKDLYTGEMKEISLKDNNEITSNELTFIGQNKFAKNWSLDYSVKFSQVKASRAYLGLTGNMSFTDDYVYRDNGEAVKSQVEDTGYGHQYAVTPEMTIKTFSSRAQLTKKWNKNKLNMGVSVQMYNPGTFYIMTSRYYTDIDKNPRVIYNPNDSRFDEHGYLVSNYNSGTEFYSGKERKYTVYAYDIWDITSRLNVKIGARLEHETVKGYYAPNKNEAGETIESARENTGQGYVFSTDHTKYYNIDKTNFNYAFNGEFLYKATNPFGFVGGLGITVYSPHLEKFGGAYVNDPKQTKASFGQLGVYLNRPFVELVSKASYIKRANNTKRMTLTSSDNSETINQMLYYDMETIGWTTDFLFSPFYNSGNSLKNFKLHFLFTIQSPKYKDYDVTAKFSNEVKNVSYSDNYLTKVSRVLMEIDPQYSFKFSNDIKGRVWLSARYYGKQYANLTNSLFYAAHWETFGGFNVSYKKFDFSTKLTNLLNQKGVNGTIGGTDLYTQEDVENLFANGNRPIYTASYIRPFTAEFTLKYKF